MMETGKLKQYLGGNTTLLYGVLDAAVVPDLPMRLFESGLPNYCLFPGDLEPDLLHLAPYLVYLPDEHEFTEWILNEGFGDDWGIFIQSRASLIEMRRQLRSLLNVYDEAGNSMTFRFYDPRVLRQFLPTCSKEELSAFFENVDALFAESETGEDLLCYELKHEALCQTELN